MFTLMMMTLKSIISM